MKKLVFATMFAALCCCSYGQKSSMSSTAQKNLASSRAVAKMFESGDFSKVGDYIAADAVDHGGMSGDVKGLDNIKASFAQMTGMMTDMKSEIVKELADDEYTFQWMKQSSTMKVDAMGMKAGTKNSLDAIEVSRFSNGKIVEHWSFYQCGRCYEDDAAKYEVDRRAIMFSSLSLQGILNCGVLKFCTLVTLFYSPTL
jgi:predicted SnoaL-like aldol condensation-catalyzing enzyme